MSNRVKRKHLVTVWSPLKSGKYAASWMGSEEHMWWSLARALGLTPKSHIKLDISLRNIAEDIKTRCESITGKEFNVDEVLKELPGEFIVFQDLPATPTKETECQHEAKK